MDNDLSGNPPDVTPGTGTKVNSRRVPLVIIGGSAGSLEPLETIINDPKIPTGAVYILVTHQDKRWSRLLTEILERNTRLLIEQSINSRELKPQHLYLFYPPKPDTADTAGTQQALPIDKIMAQFATAAAYRVSAVILSGMGSDGTLGALAVKENGGIVIAQEPNTCEYPAMPQAAIDKGYVDFIMPQSSIVDALNDIINGDLTAIRQGDLNGVELVRSNQQAMETLYELMMRRSGCDFSLYKEGTISRRLARRMALCKFSTLQQYVDHIIYNVEELDQLFRELLVDVTYFFREPEAFESLKNKALKDLLKNLKKHQTFRAWVPACSTGEEAYSLAILINEAIEAEGLQGSVMVFATDMNDQAIEIARRSVYPQGIKEHVPKHLLKKYFIDKGDGYQILPTLREKVIFARQNLINDPPFTKLDLISCRNLLIYLKGETQRRIMSIFHFALRPNGVLFLGASESTNANERLFSTIDSKHKIYKRRDALLSHDPSLGFSPVTGKSTYQISPFNDQQELGARHLRVDRLVCDILLRQYAPPSVLVNSEGLFLYLHGKTGDFLEPPEGHANMTLFEMAKPGLKKELLSAFRLAEQNEGITTIEKVMVEVKEDCMFVDLAVRTFKEPEVLQGLYLISFLKHKQEPRASEQLENATERPDHDSVLVLSRELAHTKESLQLVLQQKEWLVQDLQASNEELQSTNEELQSTNEELETSREELQAMNEELTTINAELERRVAQLFVSNDDMQNLLNSIDIATVFLDGELNIKRFTKQATKVINLRDSDIGRPISEITSKIDSSRLASEAEQVLMTLAPFECEVYSNDEHHYFLRIMAYRTSKNVINGVVITFVNIDNIKAPDKSKNDHENILAVMHTARDPMLVLDSELCFVAGNKALQSLFHWDRTVVGKPAYELQSPLLTAPGLLDTLEQVQLGIEPRIERHFTYHSDGHDKAFVASAVRLIMDSNASAYVLLAFREADSEPLIAPQ